MKIIQYIIILSISFFFILACNYVTFAENMIKEPAPQKINTYNKDITGDGMKEKIQLFGIPFTNDSDYYKDLFIEIKSKNHEWRINYGGGFKPYLQFLDINHDGIKDIIYQSKKKENINHTQIHYIKHGNIQNMGLPKQHITGNFKNDFKINIHLTPLEDPRTIDIKNNAEKYIDSGIYKKNGELKKKNTVIKIQPLTKYESMQISDSQGYGLKSSQEIYGTNKDDSLGTIETLWYFEDEKWIILQTKWAGN